MNNVIVYSHFFTVQNAEIELRKALYSMAADFTVFGMVWDEKSRKKRWKPVKTFGFYTKQNDEFRFHNGQLPRVLDCAQRTGIELDIYHMPLYEPYKETYEINEKFVLREDQEEAASFILDTSYEGSHSPLLSMPMGSGKCQPLYCKVRVPSGWKKMGDLKIDDEVCCPDGTTAYVSGIYPQGLKEAISFRFEDGRETESGMEHLWKVYIDDQDEPRIWTTAEIMKHKQVTKGRVFIDLPSNVVWGSPSQEFGPNTDSLGKWAYFSQIVMRYKLHQCENGVFVEIYDPRARQSLMDHVRLMGGIAKEIFPITAGNKPGVIVRKLPGEGGGWDYLHNRPMKEWGFLSGEGDRRIELVSFKSVGMRKQQCISIDHPDKLYITDDFIVTHNTTTSLISAARLGNRISVSVLAGYVDKWYSDLQEIYHIAPKEIYKIEGGNKLVDYCQMVLENQATPENLPRAVVISLNTMGRWFKKYMEDPYDPTLEMYGMKPWELMEKARIGTNIFDENHQHLHAVYRMFCFLHIPKTISLSATLTSTEQTELRIQNMMYPRHKRFENIKMKRYIEVFSCQYQITDIANARIRTTEYGSNNYSHVAFEKSILSHRSIRVQYLDMIRRMVQKTFVDTMEKGDKCAVFVSSHLMAKEVCKLLRHAHPDLDIRTYLESDPLENLMVSDIRVTTVLSGGTAHDIRGLTVSIQTINLNSIRSNLQVLGRLREIAGKRCKFYYLYCASIPKHVEYHMNKIEIFKDWCKERKDLMLDALRP